MIITTRRFYERIQLGLQQDDEQVREMAIGCMSFLAHKLKAQQIVLPDEVVAMLDLLPEE